MAAKKRVLAIDDEEELLDILGLWLQSHDYEVVTARDAAEGLKAAKEQKPDLIFLDIMMPGRTGFDVLQELKYSNDTSSIPVIMMTAFGSTDNILKAQDMQARDLLIKPFEFDDMIDVIRRNSV